MNYTNIMLIFILLSSKIFKLLKSLDDNTITRSSLSDKNKYLKYLDMDGKYHNKDKGLKYFIGLVYYFNLPQAKTSKYIGLIDGDDFISKKIVRILDNIPNIYNMYTVEHGYIMFAKNQDTSINIKSIYPINNFSEICGSNRFFKSLFLKRLFFKRFGEFNTSIPLTFLMKNKIVNDKFINEIMKDINRDYNIWTILPLFFWFTSYIFQ